MRKTLITLGVAALMAVPAFSTSAFAASNGYDNAIANTPCADHGAFGAFGTDGSVVHDFGVNNLGSNDRPGASNWQFPNSTTGATTAGNNSSLCGNGANPAPFAP